ncbi:MAG: rhodanese-like domain-containing protein, partial [Bacteroidales bacterium]
MEEDLIVNDFLLQSSKGVIVDVRTPAEFSQGHIVGAINIPLFTDEERVVVGTLYKQEGKDVAFERGLEFVGPKMAHF